MLKIAICDDEEKYIRDIEVLLKKYSDVNSIAMEFDKYTDGITLLNCLIDGNGYDMIFLDIEMDSINGIELAEKIRKIDKRVPIVYVTSYEAYWRRAYKVHAFQFIVKPVNEEELFSTMDDFISAHKELTEKKVQLKCEEGIVFAIQSEIYYFYIEKKKTVHVKTATDEYTVKENLRDIFEKLDNNQFYMSHKSCIINLRHVKSLENGYDIIMEDGAFLPVAQNRRTEFLDRLTDRYVNTLRGGAL